MAVNHPKITIVILAYNEEQNIRKCLDAVKGQIVKPYEVIVIDNNSIDSTVSIVKEYQKIKLIKEPKQGMSFARNTGFERARGDYVVRIDADTILPKDYIQKLIKHINENPSVAGFTGYGISRYEFIPMISIPWNIGYHMFVKAYLGHPVLWGANMVISKKYWDRLKKHLINDDSLVHEDQDLSLALASVGGKIMIVKDLTVSVQMEGLLHYDKYRRYGKMLKNLKYKDMTMRRYKLKKRLPKINPFLRLVYYLATIWAVYGFYLVTFVYTSWWNIKRFMLAH